MKKIKVLLLAFVSTGIALTSCSKDDDTENIIPGPVTSGEIMAKWNPVKTVIKVGSGADTEFPYELNEPTCNKDYVEFAASSVVNRVVFVLNGNNECEASAATTPTTWTRTNNNLVITGDVNYAGNYTITTLSGTELIIKKDQITSGITTTTTIYFTKATI